MKTLNEIKLMIENKLLASGFQKEPVFLNVPDCYFIPGEFSFEINTRCGVEYHENLGGLLVEVTEVHRHNGTEQNTSIQIEVVNWKNGRGYRISKAKIYNRNGDKTINQLIDSAIYFYNNH